MYVMKILYDGFIYNEQKAGGIGRYFSSIIGRLPDEFTPLLLLLDSKNCVELPECNRLRRYCYSHFAPHRVSKHLKKPFFASAEYLLAYDVVHPTYYTLLSGRLMSSLNKPIVLTVHDMIHELFSHLINDSTRNIKWKKDAIFSANEIICVSQSTRNDLLNLYPSVENKTTVIYEGSEISYMDSFGDEYVPIYPYFLFVGSRAVYKNFNAVLKSFKVIINKDHDIRLCVVGSPFTKEERGIISDLGLGNNIENVGFVTRNNLAKLYRCSISLIYPSLYEGFGLPPIEALTCGTAVIASNVSSIPEVVGNGAILINPTSLNDLIEAMFLLLGNSSERNRLIHNGMQWVKMFDLNISCEKIFNIYRKYKE